MLLTQALLMRGDFDRRLNAKGMVTLRALGKGCMLALKLTTIAYLFVERLHGLGGWWWC